MSKAEKASECPICREPIVVGDEIVWSAKGFCHWECRPKGKAKAADLVHQARKNPLLQAAQALLVALLTAATAWIGVKAEALWSGRDNRDEDNVRFEKALTEDRNLIDMLRERVATLEGRNAQRDFWASKKLTPVSDIPVTKDEVKQYQQKKE